MKKLILMLFSIVLFLSGCSGTTNNLSYTGTVEATQIDVSAEFSGILKEIKVVEGDQVKKGQPLGLLDDTTLVLSTSQRESAYQAQSAQVADLKKGSKHPGKDHFYLSPK